MMTDEELQELRTIARRVVKKYAYFYTGVGFIAGAVVMWLIAWGYA